MHVVDVDVMDGEAAESVFAGLDQMVTRGADVVGAVAHGERGFCGDENAIALAGDGLAEDFFGEAFGVDVSGSKRLTPASRQMSTRRVASPTSLAPQALKNSLPPPNVPAPKLSTGTCWPERPSCLNSMAGWMLRGSRRIHPPVARRELELERAED